MSIFYTTNKVGCFSTSSPKRQPLSRHVTPLDTLSLLQANQSLFLPLKCLNAVYLATHTNFKVLGFIRQENRANCRKTSFPNTNVW